MSSTRYVASNPVIDHAPATPGRCLDEYSNSLSLAFDTRTPEDQWSFKQFHFLHRERTYPPRCSASSLPLPQRTLRHQARSFILCREKTIFRFAASKLRCSEGTASTSLRRSQCSRAWTVSWVDWPNKHNLQDCLRECICRYLTFIKVYRTRSKTGTDTDGHSRSISAD
jgi:hypothetical protein